MHEVTSDPAALDVLRAQRNKLADRMRLPWWCWAGVAVVWALVFAGPFSSQYLSEGFYWAIAAAAVAVAGLVQWGLARVTGIRVGFRDLLDRPGRPARIATLVVALAVIEIVHLLVERGLSAAAIVVAALGTGAQLAVQVAAVREFRRELRDGEWPA